MRITRTLGGCALGALVGAAAVGLLGSSGGDGTPAAAAERSPSTTRVAAVDRATVLRGRVARVIDGDTIHVTVAGERTVVRLIGIDTPETVHPSIPVQCWGPQASATTRRMLPIGMSVRLESDPTQDVRDRYGRFLGYAYLGNRRGGASVNRALVAAGAAKSYVYGGRAFRYVRAFQQAERTAKSKRLGLWGPPCRGSITQAAVRPAPVPKPASAPPRSGANCDPNYTGACVPPYPPDLDCADIGARVRVVGGDPHRLDGDGNGWGCERYG